MSSTQIAVTIVVVALIALLGAGLWFMLRRRALRERFGPEYDRVVAERDGRRAAERELLARKRRHDQLELSELSDDARARYTSEWQQLQEHFIDAPDESVGAADQLVSKLIAERGYPTGDYDEQLAQLSVEHARTLSQYREAHEISMRNQRGEATTEQLRQALVHYRALVAELLGTEPVGFVERNDPTPHR